jgi:hypothetical protein
MTCLTEDRLLAWIDGGIAPNQKGPIARHLAGCADCRGKMSELEALLGDLAAPPSFDESAHVASVMKRLDAGDAQGHRAARRPLPRWFARMGAAAAVLAVAAATVLVVRGRGLPEREPDFVARGARQPPSLRRDVGTRIFTGARSLVALDDGATIDGASPLTASYSNVHPTPAYALVFAVDSKGTVHWLFPAYADERENPESVLLERAPRERLFPTSVVLDAPAPGPLRIVSLITEVPLHVADVDRRGALDLSPRALEGAFAGASATEIRVTMGSH